MPELTGRTAAIERRGGGAGAPWHGVAAAALAALALLAAAGATAAPAAAAPPTASIAVSPGSPVAGEAVTFVAHAQDPDGSIASYAWELDGDTDFADGSEPEASRTFDSPGTYTIYLRVVDDSGEAFVVYTDVVVSEPGSVPPEPEPTPAPVPTPAPPPSPPPTPLMDPFPVVRIAGTVTSAGARLTLVTVRAPRGARIVAFCRGTGCRRRRLARRARGIERLRPLEARYRAGARIVIRVTGRRRVGKYTRVVVRRGIPPARVDRCLWPGQPRPLTCP